MSPCYADGPGRKAGNDTEAFVSPRQYGASWKCKESKGPKGAEIGQLIATSAACYWGRGDAKPQLKPSFDGAAHSGQQR